jgi:hypothetical protein
MAATFFLRFKVLSRARGEATTQAAAYRAGERIRDRRTSKSYDHSDREDVAYKEIVLPAEWDNCAEVNWAREREALWNAAEFAGKRCNARVGREILTFLPPELTAEQRLELVRGFSRELAEKYRGAVDVAIHTPRPDADERHHHAHFLMTTREITREGLGRRTALEIDGADRGLRGLHDYAKDERQRVRVGWANATNEAFRRAGLTIRVDPRSYEDQGIDREPTPISNVRKYVSPRLLMPSRRSLPPEEACLGTKPRTPGICSCRQPMPLAITIPYSLNSPRIWLACAVRAATNPCRARCNASKACCSTVLMGTKRFDLPN